MENLTSYEIYQYILDSCEIDYLRDLYSQDRITKAFVGGKLCFVFKDTLHYSNYLTLKANGVCIKDRNGEYYQGTKNIDVLRILFPCPEGVHMSHIEEAIEFYDEMHDYNLSSIIKKTEEDLKQMYVDYMRDMYKKHLIAISDDDLEKILEKIELSIDLNIKTSFDDAYLKVIYENTEEDD